MVSTKNTKEEGPKVDTFETTSFVVMKSAPSKPERI
jgi:hypothetical protein